VEVDIVPNYSSVELFLRHGVIATWAMWYNEYHLVLNSGYNPDELTVFSLKDTDLGFPEDGIYCLERTYRKDPSMCKAFAAASVKGWLYAFKHREEALDIVMKHAEAAFTGTNRAHQNWMLARMEDLILPGGRTDIAGKLDPRDYEAVGGALQENRIIDEFPPLREFYKGPE
jgi:NitT/TauT family transport system substrate-binding protein